MNFAIPEELAALRAEIRQFMADAVIPAEAQILDEDSRREYGTLRSLQERARALGLWLPHMPPAWGGRGLGIMGMCVLFREMGRSPVGPRIFNCDAPDQGNMDLLAASGTEAQKEKYLGPLCRGEITSAFCMTEPAPGAGADPANLRTVAEADGDGFRISGHKWFSTGGGASAVLIVMARTSPDNRNGATMFLVGRHEPGVEHVRDIPGMGPEILAHRESEFRFHNVRAGPDAILGGVGNGFRLAQARLVPARLTHCMRWLGLAERALGLCRAYVAARESFGRTLAHHQLVQQKFADAAERIHAGNLMTFHCASMLEKGLDKEARPYSSMAKRHVANTLCQVLDDAIQMHGALGYSNDMPFASWYRFARAARIADGPDEVHTMVIARDCLMGRLDVLV